jgi:RimJ/RimL family protein N-acetyltransferase
MTVHVEIRPHRPDDADALLAAIRESMTELMPWMPWCHPGYGMNDARGFLETANAGRRDGTQFDFAVLADGVYAGACGINRIDQLNRVANLGYWMRSPLAGRGIMARAVRLLIDWTLAHTDLVRIEIVAAVGNTRSQRVAEKVGAVREAVLANRTMTATGTSAAVMYAVLRDA